ESEGRLRSLIQSAPTVVLFLSPEGRILEFNAEAERLYGRSRNEALGMNYIDAFLPEEEREGVAADMREVLEGKPTLGFENEIVTGDGTRRLLSWNVGRVPDARERPAGIVAVGLDITERRRAEDLIRGQRDLAVSLSMAGSLEEGFRVALDAAISVSGMDCGGIYVVDDTTGALDMPLHKGLSPEFVGAVSHFGPDTPHARVVMAGNAVYTGYEALLEAPSAMEAREGLKAIGVIPMRHLERIVGCLNIASHSVDSVPESSRVALETIAGQIGGAIARLKAERELQESEEKFRSIVESSPMGIHLYELRPDGGLVFTGANPAADRILGVENSQFIGRTIEEAFPPAAESEIPERYRRAAADGEGWQTSQFAYEHGKISGAYDVYAFQTSPGKMATFFLDVTERELAAKAVRDAQEALRESERKFRGVVESSPMGIFETDRDGRVLYTNPQWRSITGMQIEESLGFGWTGALHPDDRERILAEWNDCLREKKGYSGRFRFVRPSGETRLVYTRTTPILDEAGEVVRHVGANEDITERERAVSALRESEERFRALTESTSDFVWETDAEDAYTYASPKVRDLLGYEPSEVVGRTPFDLMPPDEAERVRSVLAEIKSRAEPFSGLENTNVRRDGRQVVIETGGVPFFDDEGHLRGYRGIDRDITERKRAENELREAHDDLERRVEERTAELAEANEQLRRSEETYRSLVTHLPDAVTVTGPDGVIRYVSGHRAELHGVGSVDEMLGLRTADLVVPEDRERFDASLRQAFDTGAAEAAEFAVLRRDGSTFIAEESFGVLRGADGKPNSVVTVVRDVTGRKELERRLVESQRLEAVGRLAGGLAHDFNNLLTAIGGFANRILKKLRPENPLRADAAQIRKASDMAASLTSQLLAFSRRQIMQPVVLTLNEVLEDVEMMLQRLIGEDVELVIRRAPAPGLTLADPGQIGQVIVNLAVNARDAMPFGGSLTIETSDVEFGPEEAPDHPGVPPGEYVTVSVTDTGAGIPPDVLPHIFEPFYTTKEQGKGTGLGLSTVYGIVTQSGGHVRV
ncbi:MAG: PAS domain S-box protein, partial [Planctomycetota bacterium]